MPASRVVRLFKNGRSQAVRIPQEMRLPGNEAVIRRVGNTLVLEPHEAGWSTEFLDFLKQPPSPKSVGERSQPKRAQRRSWR